MADHPRAPLFIACIAVAAALLVSAATGRFALPDRWEYSDIARHLLHGKGALYEFMGAPYYFYGPPLYPLLLAGTLALTGSELPMLFIQAGLCAATALILYGLAAELWDRRVAFLAALLIALHPGALVYAGRLHSQALDVFLIVLGFMLWLKVGRDTRPVRALGTGAVLGLAMLSRGTMGPAIAAWLMHFVWRHRTAGMRALAVASAVALGVALVLAPLVIRGYRLYGEVVPLRTDTGANLWSGNHPGATGTSHTADPVPEPVMVRHLTETDRRALATMNEVEQHRYFSKKAWDFVTSDPAAAARLFARKLFYYWWASPHTGHSYPRPWSTVYLAYYACVLAFGVLGLWSAWRSGSAAASDAATAFVLMALFVSLTQAAFYVEGRHRWQLEPMLLMFAAAGISRFRSWLRRGSSPPVTIT